MESTYLIPPDRAGAVTFAPAPFLDPFRKNVFRPY